MFSFGLRPEAGTGEGVNAVRPETAELVFTGHVPTFKTEYAIVPGAAELKFTGYPPTFKREGPAVVIVPTGSMEFRTFLLPPELSAERTEVVPYERRYVRVAAVDRFELVDADDRYELVPPVDRFELVPEEVFGR